MTTGPAWGLQEPQDSSTDSHTPTDYQALTEPHSDSLVGIIGSAVSLPEIEINLSEKQRQAICLIYRAIFVDGGELSSQEIWKNWPESINSRENDNFFRAGPRPSINNIQAFMGSEDFAIKMETLGINVNLDETGLSVEQLGLLQILTNPTDGRTLKGKLKAAGVTWSIYQAWMKHPKFQEMYKKWAGQTLLDAIPAAETQLANAMASGDMSAIRFGMEVTGRHDPANRKQVDAQKLVGLILEVLEEEIKDTDILRAIGTKIQLRALNALE